MSIRNYFEQWYRLTHWNYGPTWLEYVDGRYTTETTQAMYHAYRAGFNKHKKANKKEGL